VKTQEIVEVVIRRGHRTAGSSTREPPSCAGICFELPRADLCWTSFAFVMFAVLPSVRRQFPHPRLNLVDKAEVVVITDVGVEGHGQAPLHEPSGLRSAADRRAQGAQSDPGQLSVRRLVKKRHGGGHEQTRLGIATSSVRQSRDACQDRGHGQHMSGASEEAEAFPPGPARSGQESCQASRREPSGSGRGTPATRGPAGPSL